MSDRIGPAQVCWMLEGAARQVRAHHERLSRLDGAVGDGDHGATMLRAMEAAAKAASANSKAGLKALFSAVAWGILSCDGGATGPLLGSFFLGLSDAVGEKAKLDCADLVSVFEGGVEKMQQQTRARIGDKTMMDALLPALAALKAADPAAGIEGALRQAAEAAAKGAEATEAMRAKFGRARNLGDRVLGHLDPGAVSVSLLLKGFHEGACQADSNERSR
jgi:phosphoenolpyruvate---glycerone phosphotransferase subunit DhaL